MHDLERYSGRKYVSRLNRKHKAELRRELEREQKEREQKEREPWQIKREREQKEREQKERERIAEEARRRDQELVGRNMFRG